MPIFRDRLTGRFETDVTTAAVKVPHSAIATNVLSTSLSSNGITPPEKALASDLSVSEGRVKFFSFD